MPTVRFGFTPEPVHVRTARLVAASVAQQATLPAEFVDEVRQAAGEACSRAVARHRRYAVRELVRMKLSIGDRFVTEVADFAPVTRNAMQTPRPIPGSAATDVPDEDILTEEVALTLLAGLVADLQVIEGEAGLGTIIRMAWPL